MKHIIWLCPAAMLALAIFLFVVSLPMLRLTPFNCALFLLGEGFLCASAICMVRNIVYLYREGMMK
jgi:hypothetical protein